MWQLNELKLVVSGLLPGEQQSISRDAELGNHEFYYSTIILALLPIRPIDSKIKCFFNAEMLNL